MNWLFSNRLNREKVKQINRKKFLTWTEWPMMGLCFHTSIPKNADNSLNTTLSNVRSAYFPSSLTSFLHFGQVAKSVWESRSIMARMSLWLLLTTKNQPSYLHLGVTWVERPPSIFIVTGETSRFEGHLSFLVKFFILHGFILSILSPDKVDFI